jgi:hypothetical protein
VSEQNCSGRRDEMAVNFARLPELLGNLKNHLEKKPATDAI